MTRETRNNLLFLAILIVLTLPGAIIMFRRKLSPYAPTNMVPEARPLTTAYIDPGPLPPDIARVVPHDATAWTASLRHGQPVIDPVISEHRLFEIVDLQASGQSCDASLVIWGRGYSEPGLQLSARLTTAGMTIPGQGAASGPIRLPENVVSSLQTAGYTRTPHQVQTAHFRFPLTSGLTLPVTLTLDAISGNQRTQDSVQLFANPFSANK